MGIEAEKIDFDAWDKEIAEQKPQKSVGIDFDAWDKEIAASEAVEQRGLPGDIVSGIVRGVAVEMPSLFLDTAAATERIARKAFGYEKEQEVGPIGEMARSGKESLEQFRSEHPILRAKEKPGIISQGVEAAAMSISSGTPGALTGFAIGSMFGPASPVTAPMGALIGFAMSGGITFGLAEYENVIQMADEQGIDRAESEPAAIWSGLAEGGFEFASDLITGGLLKVAKPLTAPAKEGLKSGIRQVFKMGVKEALARSGAVLASETSMEMLTAGVQAEQYKKIGLGDATFWEGAKQAMGPAFVASVIFAGIGTGATRLHQVSIRRKIENGAIDPKKRMQAANEVGEILGQVDKDLAKAWRVNAFEAIKNKEDINIDDPDLIRVTAVNRAQKENNVTPENIEAKEQEIKQEIHTEKQDDIRNHISLAVATEGINSVQAHELGRNVGLGLDEVNQALIRGLDVKRMFDDADPLELKPFAVHNDIPIPASITDGKQIVTIIQEGLKEEGSIVAELAKQVKNLEKTSATPGMEHTAGNLEKKKAALDKVLPAAEEEVPVIHGEEDIETLPEDFEKKIEELAVEPEKEAEGDREEGRRLAPVQPEEGLEGEEAAPGGTVPESVRGGEEGTPGELLEGEEEITPEMPVIEPEVKPVPEVVEPEKVDSAKPGKAVEPESELTKDDKAMRDMLKPGTGEFLRKNGLIGREEGKAKEPYDMSKKEFWPLPDESSAVISKEGNIYTAQTHPEALIKLEDAGDTLPEYPKTGYVINKKFYEDKEGMGDLHKQIVQQAINEGKIDSHPDYPELKAPQEATAGKAKEPWEMSARSKEYADMSIDELDKAAFGFSREDIKTLKPEQLTVKYGEDLKNVEQNIVNSGLSTRKWAETVDLSEPIDVSYENGKFNIEDGHNRYFAAKTLGRPLNINLQIKDKPHKAIVTKALLEGKPVPKEVLAEYPDLKAPQEATAGKAKEPYEMTEGRPPIEGKAGKPISETFYRAGEGHKAIDDFKGLGTFAGTKQVAKNVAGGKSEIVSVDIKLNNPFEMTNSQFRKHVGFGKPLRDKLIADGYDGLVIRYKDGNIGEVVSFKKATAGKAPPSPEGTKVASEGQPRGKPKAAAGKNIRTLRGAIKNIGGINFLNFKGELRETPTAVKFLSRKSGVPIDDAVRQLREDGWLDKDVDVPKFIEMLRQSGKGGEHEGFLSRDRILRDIAEKKESELTAEEKRLKEEMAWEPESPPEGEYEKVNVDSLEDGETYTILDGRTRDGWDEYKVKKTEGGVLLEDGETIELEPWDEVQVLKKKEAKTKTEVIDPSGLYVDWSQVKTTEKDGLKQTLYGTFKKDGTFKAWKNKSDIERIKKAKGKPTLTLKQDDYGKQRPSGEKGEQQGLGLVVEDKDQPGLFSKTDKDKPLYSFAGTAARTSNMTSLMDAHKMEGKGEDMEAIRKKTGWFLDVDNHWKFEIDDSAIRIRDKGKGEWTSLGDAVKHDKLFQAYPQLKDVQVKITIDEDLEAPSGSLNARPVGKYEDGGIKFEEKYSDWQIFVRAPNMEDAKSTLLHEIQHGIQTVEGFAKGGSPAIGVSKLSQSAEKRKKQIISRMDEIEAEKQRFIETETEGFTVRKDKSKLIDKFWDNNEDLWNEWQDLDNEKLNLYTKDGFDQYKRLAGEVEARETAARKDLTPEQRKAEMPYKNGIPREDVIVRFDQRMAESRGEESKPKTPAEKVFDIVIPHIQGMTNFPTVKVVQSIDQLPKHLKNKVTAFSKKGNKQVEGFYDKVSDQVFMIADNLSEGRIEAVLRHEAEGHRGIRLLLGPDLNGFLDGIGKAKKDELLKFDSKLNLKDQEAVRVAADEWIARKIEAGNLGKSFWDDLVRIFRKWLRKFVPNLDLSDGEIRSVLTDTVKNVREGRIDRIRTPEGMPLFSTAPDQEIETLEQEIKTLRQNFKEKVKTTNIKQSVLDATGKLRLSDIVRETRIETRETYQEIERKKKGIALLKSKAKRQEDLFNAKLKKHARDRVNKIINGLKKIDTKRMSPEQAAAINGILDAVDLTKLSLKKQLRLEKTRRYLDNNPDTEMPDHVLKDLERLDKSAARDLTLDDLESLNIAVLHHAHLDKVKQKIRVGRQDRQRQNVLNSAMGEMKHPKKVRTGIVSSQKGPLGRIKRTGRLIADTFGIRHDHFDLIVESLSGQNSTMDKVLYQTVKEGITEELKYKQQTFKKFQEDLGDFEKKHKIKDLTKWMAEVVKIDRFELSRGERMSLYRHSLNADNKRAIIQGGFGFKFSGEPNRVHNITKDEFNTLIDSITDAEKDFAGKPVDNLFADQIERLDAVFLEKNGYALPREENYHPKDTMPLARGIDMEVEDALEKFKGTWLRVGVSKGMLEKRKRVSLPIYLNSITYDINTSVSKSAAYIGLEIPLSNASKLLYDPTFRLNLSNNYGEQTWKEIEKGLRDIAGEYKSYTTTEQLALKAKNQLATAMLGLNPFVVSKQVLSLPVYLPYVKSKYLIMGVLDNIWHPKEITSRHKMYSPEYLERIEGGYSRDVADVFKAGAEKRVYGGAKSVKEKFMSGIKLFDQAAVNMGMHGAVLQALDEFKAGKLSREVGLALDMKDSDIANLTPERKMALAYKFADYATQRTQPMFSPEHRSSLSRGSTIEKLATMFGSFTNQALNLTRRSYREAVRTGDKQAYAKFSKSLMVIFVINTLGVMAIDDLRDRLYGRDGKTFVGRVLSSWSGYMFFVRDLASSVISKIERGTFLGYDVSIPVSRIPELLSNVIANGVTVLAEKDIKKRNKAATNFVDDSLELTTMLSGIPYSTPKKLGGRILFGAPVTKAKEVKASDSHVKLIRSVRKNYKELLKTDPDKAVKYYAKHKNEIRMWKYASNVSSRMSRLQKRIDTIMESKTLSPDAKRRKVALLNDALLRMAQRFNKRYDELK